MLFTPLETVLIAAGLSLVVGIASSLIGDKKFVSQSQCRERHGDVCEDLKAFKEDQRRKSLTQFRMLRALIVHNKDIPPEKQEQILNETPGGE